MKQLVESRRDFLKAASIAAVLPLFYNCKAGTLAGMNEKDPLEAIRKNAILDPSSNWWGAKDAPANVGWKTSLAKPAEKAQRIMIVGTIYRADGKTPAPNVLIYLYHTDVHGKYGQNGEHRHGLYRGWMLTDERGRYEFDSIMPASYPDSTQSAHIHMTLTGTDFKEDWIDSILFEGDRFLTARERVPQRGGFDPVLKMEKGSDGVLRGVRNIKLMI